MVKILLEKVGMRVVSGFKSLGDNPVGRWVETMIAGTAQLDNEVRTERSTNGMKAAVQAGRYVWGAGIGYINTGGRGSNLALDNPEIVRLVRKCWEYIDTGYTQEEARKAVTKDGLRMKNGKPISKSHFPRIL